MPLAYDGDPSTAWSTLTYRGSPAFGNLKPGVGLVLDLGAAQELAGVTLDQHHARRERGDPYRRGPGATLDDFAPAADGTVEDETELAFEEPVSAQFVLVWITGLVDNGDGFTADIAEITVQTAG